MIVEHRQIAGHQARGLSLDRRRQLTSSREGRAQLLVGHYAAPIGGSLVARTHEQACPGLGFSESEGHPAALPGESNMSPRRLQRHEFFAAV